MMKKLKEEIVSKRPYRKWLDENLLPLADVPYTGNLCPVEETRLYNTGKKYLVIPMKRFKKLLLQWP